MDDDGYSVKVRTLVNGEREYRVTTSDNEVRAFSPFTDYEDMEMDCE